MKNKKICFIYPSNMIYESRIIKLNKLYLSIKNITKVIKIGINKNKIEEKIVSNEKEIIYLLPFSSKFPKIISFLLWYINVLKKLIIIRPDIVSCESLSSAPICIIYCKLKKTKLIYSPHEYECYTPEYNNKLKRLVALFLEDLVINISEAIITVSPSIMKLYKNRYPRKKVSYAINLPEEKSQAKEQINYSKTYYEVIKRIDEIRNIDSNNIIFLYQGLLNESRCIEEIANGFENFQSKYYLLIIGFGELYFILNKKYKRSENIFIFDPVMPNEVNEIVHLVDMGFSFLSKNCLNHELALPNKLLSYLSNGVPVISNGRRQITKILKQYNSGISIFENSDRNIERIIAEINTDNLHIYKEGAKRFMKNNSWKEENRRLKIFLSKVLE